MDEKMVALLGAAAGVTLAGGARPVMKLAMRGAIAAAEATTGAQRILAELYAEAKAEQRGAQADAESVSASRPST